ncbi:MAG: DUF1365 domain-containing protein [Acidiferrobacterales bacterium]|nr:DUF1365 domain-containing protein [Acidiferrobacterales bacterium]
MDSRLKLYVGTIHHIRNEPRRHQFSYKYFQTWLDVEKPQLIDEISPFWSSRKFNLVRFKRSNYQPGEKPLHSSISDIIYARTGHRFKGAIYLLGNLSHWGYCFNPVCFYFCYDTQENLQYILSEVHNTPWGERFTYLHDVCQEKKLASSRPQNPSNGNLTFESSKEFHVSPFMPMKLNYQWKFKLSDDKIVINMNLFDKSKSIFNASMTLKEQALNSKNATLLALKYPLISISVLFNIYWQALRLWIKRVPFYSHPRKS